MNFSFGAGGLGFKEGEISFTYEIPTLTLYYMVFRLIYTEALRAGWIQGEGSSVSSIQTQVEPLFLAHLIHFQLSKTD